MPRTRLAIHHGNVSSAEPHIQVVVRRWKYAPPPWRVYEALADERDHWLQPSRNERTPSVVDAVVNERLVLAPWVDAEIDHVEVLIGTDEDGYGAALTVAMYADHELTTDRRKEVRYRLGTLFGAALRDWVDGS